jgi:hypothetical protein
VVLDFFGELNWLAVLVAAAAWFAFSAIWYSLPPLSSAWQKAARVQPSQGPPLVMLLIPTFIGYLVTTIGIALLARALGASTFSDGVGLGVVIGLAFGVVTPLVSQLYEQKGATYWLINGVNALIAYLIVAVIVTVWD